MKSTLELFKIHSNTLKSFSILHWCQLTNAPILVPTTTTQTPLETTNTNKSLKELAAPNLNHQPLCIDFPNLDASFELRSGLIHLLPTFRGLTGE